jgi:hypothetical protein
LDIPIHKPAEIESGEIEVPSHKYWGGMILGHAQAEFRNSVGLVYLFESAGVNPLRRVAYPINVAQLHAVPRVQNGEVTWTPEFDYLFNMLEVLSHNRADQLGVFVSTSQSDVRLSQIVNRIFSRSEQSESDIIECRNEILSALRYLFEVNGRNFEDPQIPFVPNGASIGTRDYQLFVNKILEHNEAEGLRLYETLSRKLLSSLGLVHGAGGFLGGGYNGSGGAIGGGAVAIRNVDCCGVLHDLDEQQAMDRFFLKDTLYWLESLLVGREVPEGCSLQTVSVLSRFNKGAYFGTAPLTLTSVVDSLRADTPRQQQQRLFREPTETTELECRKIWCLTDQERSAYDKARSRGAQFGRAWKKPR